MCLWLDETITDIPKHKKSIFDIVGRDRFFDSPSGEQYPFDFCDYDAFSIALN